MKTFYNITRQLSGRKKNINRPVRTSDGSILSKTSEQLDRWTEYFNSLLNCTLVDNPPVIEGWDDLDVNLGPISRAEVVEAIKKTKSGKAPDPDNIPPEAMKADPRVTIQTSWLNCWRIRGEKTKYQRYGRQVTYCQASQTRESQDCQNWRGIHLLSPSK